MLKLTAKDDGVLDIQIDQGETFRLPLTWYDANKEEVSLSGYTARMHLREEFEDEDPTLELTTENGRITLTSPGQIQLEVAAEDMADIEAGSYRYDLELVDSDDAVKKLIKGKFKVKAEVTK